MNRSHTLAVLLVLSSISYSTSNITSDWRTQEIIIDGNLNEWGENFFLPKGGPVSIAFLNDENNLFVAMKTTDRNSIVQSIMNDLTVWFDPKGGKNKSLGLKYSSLNSGRIFKRLMTRHPQSDEEFDQVIQEVLMTQFNLEIIHNGETQILQANSDIRVKIQYIKGQLSYELMIPLTELNVENGNKISVCFETSEIDFGDRRPPPPRGRRGRGQDFGGRTPPERPRMPSPEVPESIEIWVSLSLDMNDSN